MMQSGFDAGSSTQTGTATAPNSPKLIDQCGAQLSPLGAICRQLLASLLRSIYSRHAPVAQPDRASDF
jgi:hypothetical protein